jgi:hypothetical protein
MTSTKPGERVAFDASAATAEALAAEYDRLRDELKRALAAPVKDMPAVNRIIDRLDKVHMDFKAAHGLKGNNPNE